MTDSLNLLDLLLSGSEYCSTSSNINECLEDPRNYYVEHDLQQCSAPNKYFEAHQELLYILDSDGKKECRLDNSYKNGLFSSDIEFIEDLILDKNSISKIVFKNLEGIFKISPQKLEKIIIDYYKDGNFGVLKKKITGEFSKTKDYKGYYVDLCVNAA